MDVTSLWAAASWAMQDASGRPAPRTARRLPGVHGPTHGRELLCLQSPSPRGVATPAHLYWADRCQATPTGPQPAPVLPSARPLTHPGLPPSFACPCLVPRLPLKISRLRSCLQTQLWRPGLLGSKAMRLQLGASTSLSLSSCKSEVKNHTPPSRASLRIRRDHLCKAFGAGH